MALTKVKNSVIDRGLDLVSDLASVKGSSEGEVVTVKGYHSVGDGGGGEFYWSTTGTANGGTIFAGSTGFWHRIYSGAVNVKWFGAYSDGTNATVTAAAIQTAIDTVPSLASTSLITNGAELTGGGIVFFPKGKYLYDTGLNVVNSGVTLQGEGSKKSFLIFTANSSVGITYYDSSNTDASKGRFAVKGLSIANDAGPTGVTAGTNGTGIYAKSFYASAWEDVEFYYWNTCLDIEQAYSNTFTNTHYFTSAIGPHLSNTYSSNENTVGNTFIGGTVRVANINDLGDNNSFIGMDIEPMYDGTSNYFGENATVQNCYFEPATTSGASSGPYIYLSDNCKFENNIVAWSVSVRPDDFLIEISGKGNVVRGNAFSYLDRVIKLTTTSHSNEIDMLYQHNPVATSTEMYAQFTVLDLGIGNKVKTYNNSGVITTDYGFSASDDLTKVESSYKFTNLCGSYASASLSNMTNVASASPVDPFGGDVSYSATISTGGAGSIGSLTFPTWGNADGSTYYTSSMYVYIATGSTVETILLFGGAYATGKTIAASDLPKDKWIRLTQVSQPVVGGGSVPNVSGFVITGPAGAAIYHAYSTCYEGQNIATPALPSSESYYTLSPDALWKANAHTASDYTASTGTCTVDAADLTAYRYRVNGKSLEINLRIDTFSLSDACGSVNVKLPEGLLAKVTSITPCYLAQSTTMGTGAMATTAGSNVVNFYADPFSATGWSAGTDNKTIGIHTTIEVQ